MAFRNLIGGKANSNPQAKATSKAAMPVPRTVSPPTAVDAGTTISGKLRCRETLRIDGRVKGDVRCDKTVIIGEGGRVEATIQAESVVISGEVKGNVVARCKITLERTARVTGDLETPGIVIEEGAKLEGRIVIGAEAVQAEIRPGSLAQRGAQPAASRGTTPPPT